MMDLLIPVLIVVWIVGVYRMVISESRWLSYLGIAFLLLMMVYLAARVGYHMHTCDVEPVTQYMELRVSNTTQFNESR